MRLLLPCRMLWWCRTLTWSCPLRPLLQLREPHLAAFSENTGARMQCLGAVANRRYELIHGRNGSLLPTETLSSPTQLSLFSVDSANEQLREFSLQDLVSKAILSSGHHQTYDSGSTLKCTVLENFDQNFKALSFYGKRLIKKTYLQLRKRPRDICKPSNSYMVKTQFTIPKGHRQNLANPYSWSTRQVWLVKHIHSSPQPRSFSFHQTRPIYMAVPHVEEAWKSCLSLENEIRCRQCLGPNLQLYESDTGRKGLIQSLRKNESKWASVLVSLCSVEEEPAFLFTLRSSKLKGRHKGDVSFAGGKRDPSDRDVVATALREAREELGVHVTTERVWGILKPLRDMSGMMIAPVLANIGPLEKFTFKPNPEEVEEIFTLSLSHLCNPQNRGYTHFRTGNKYGYTTPVFRNGKHRVWGLTAVALDHTLKLIVPP